MKKTKVKSEYVSVGNPKQLKCPLCQKTGEARAWFTDPFSALGIPNSYHHISYACGTIVDRELDENGLAHSSVGEECFQSVIKELQCRRLLDGNVEVTE